MLPKMNNDEFLSDSQTSEDISTLFATQPNGFLFSRLLSYARSSTKFMLYMTTCMQIFRLRTQHAFVLDDKKNKYEKKKEECAIKY